MAVINLYDLYVAFWRFALSTLLERQAVQQPRGIVSYITNRTWLRGKAYAGMREWLREREVRADIVDLGGDVRAGARRDDEGVFAIMAGCAIGTLVFGGTSATGEGVHYRRLRGTRADKLRALSEGNLPDACTVDGVGGDPFGPVDWGALANAPAISDYFARNFPGVKTHRDHLVIDVTRDRLFQKLEQWSVSPDESRAQEFHRSADRNVPRRDYPIDCRLFVVHRYRPLDNRVLFGDRPFIDRPGRIWPYCDDGAETPALVCLDARTSEGPAVIATVQLPGYNSFRGSYETHVFPLLPTNADATLHQEEVLSRAASEWAASFDAKPLDVGAYLLALGNAPTYVESFREALETDIVRFPATRDEGIFWDAVNTGRTLLDAWALRTGQRGQWTQEAAGGRLGRPRFDGSRITFESGDQLDGLHPDTWSFAVSGYPVMQRFLEARQDLPLSVELAEQTMRVAQSISVILDAQLTCERILARAISVPDVSF